VTPVHLSLLDGVVILLFLGAILGLGFSAKLRDSSILQYLAAGRALSLPAFVATLVSTWYGGILGVAESVQYFGVGAWTLVGVPYYLFAILYGFVFAGRVRAGDQISIPERLEVLWGRKAAVAGAVLIFLLAVPAAHVLMLGVLTQLLTGWDRWVAVIVAAVVGTLFLYRGGLLADVRVSLLAFVMMYVGFAVILVWCLAHFPVAEAWTRLPVEMKNWDGGGGAILVISFLILGAWTLVDPGFHQRVASARDPATGRAGVFVSAVCWMVFDLLSIGTALYAFAAMESPPAGLEVFPRFGSEILPDGLRALFFCGMIGTILSAMVGYTLVAGSAFGRDTVARIAGLGEGDQKRWTQVGLAVSTVIAVLLGIMLNSVVSLWYAWGGCVVGALLIPVCVSYLRSRSSVKPGVVVASMGLSFLFSFTWLFYGYRTNNPLLEVGFIEGRIIVPPPEGADVLRIGVGTLVPALVISALVLAFGSLAQRKTVR
jgi:SSS family solute:Na+ symporter